MDRNSKSGTQEPTNILKTVLENYTSSTNLETMPMGETDTLISKNHKIAIIASLSILAIIYWILFDFLRQIEFDTSSFIGASRLMFHLEGGYNFQSRLSKPLVLILPGLVEYLSGIHPKHIFLAQNLVCYYALGFIVYKTIYLITQNTRQALLAVLAYFMCQPFAVYSLFYLVDTVGWFFGFYTIYLTLKYFPQPIIDAKKVTVISCIAGIGMLTKESAIVGILFMILYLLFNFYPLKTKIKYLFLASLFFLIPFLVSNMLTQKYYGVSVFQRVIEQQTSQGLVFYNKGNFQQLFRIVDVYWVLFAVGLWQVFKSFRLKNSGNTLGILLLTALIALLLMPLYPFIVDRILFMVAPILIVFIAIGSSLFEKFAYPAIIIGGIINISMTYLIYRYNTSGILLKGLVLYLLILTAFFIVKKFREKKLIITPSNPPMAGR
ncbi:MAG TPA: hypothetical protein DCQ26_18730 [Marinilabiliales bacterium]|nr:MAG: hypothetical protein A2W95_07515 [Bacteroidetes bacterium GWA2_40_14]OFZ23722.1 MAG: hypothetical protein A2437_06720 [Bacteroidetes bacterium RIFOXYC2_FULL_40_12]HAN00634.1 hypothetical protein [Marinilabiliales bacterium]HAZ03551.1 hypothetical protein [Marinilabiliales bacterium]HBO75632.1 hypothetical protein [Marinilabiliales bacterium]